jgi:hypothetical protein
MLDLVDESGGIRVAVGLARHRHGAEGLRGTGVSVASRRRPTRDYHAYGGRHLIGRRRIEDRPRRADPGTKFGRLLLAQPGREIVRGRHPERIKIVDQSAEGAGVERSQPLPAGCTVPERDPLAR